MNKRPIPALIVTIVSSLLIGLFAAHEANAAPMVSATLAKAVPSGIGLAPDLNRTAPGTLANATDYDKALRSSLWVRTPAGLVFRSCTYNVPNGSKVDSIHGGITLPNGRSLSMTRCAYPRLVQPKAPRSVQVDASQPLKPTSAQAHGLTSHGWMQGFQEDRLPPLGYLDVSYAAPSAPAKTASDLEDYMWSALASDPTGGSLLQPAAGWGTVGTIKDGTVISNASGQYLDMAAYYYWSGNAVAASFVRINAKDTLDVHMSSSNCNSSGGDCTWFLEIYDENTEGISDFTVGSSPAYTTLIGGMLESKNASGCDMLFANHNIAFRNIYVDTVAGSAVSPDFYENDTDQECSMNSTFNSTGGNIYWNS